MRLRTPPGGTVWGHHDLPNGNLGDGAAGGGRMSAFQPPGDCPNCGEAVPAGKTACPHCGADGRTGWSEETYLDGVDLPGEDDGEPARIAEREHGEGWPRSGKAWLALGLAVLLASVLSGAWWLVGR